MTAPPVYPRGDQYPPFGDWTTIKGVVSSAYLERDQQMIVRWSPFWESMTETGYVRPVDESLNPDVEARFPTVGDVMQMIAQGATTLPGERILGLRASDSGLIVRAGVDETSAHEMEVSWPELSTLINSVRDLRDETEEYATDARGVIDAAVGDLRGELAVINGIASAAAQVALDAAEQSASAPVQLSGRGFPEGVVAAPPGAVYTDLNMTNGAVQWIKRSGTGSTGWWILAGDTGWREIPLQNTMAGWSVRLRRINDTVYLTHGTPFAFGLWKDVPYNPVVNEVSYSLPAGWRTAVTRMVIPIYNQDHEMAGSVFVMPANDMPRFGIVTKAVIPRALINGSWAADEPWPSSLPGTPV